MRCQSPEPFGCTKSKVTLLLRRFLDHSHLQEREGEKEKLQEKPAKGQQRGAAGVKPALPQTSWPGGQSSLKLLVHLNKIAPFHGTRCMQSSFIKRWHRMGEVRKARVQRWPQDNHHSPRPQRHGPDPAPCTPVARPRVCLTGADQQKICPMCAAQPSCLQTCSWEEGPASP